MKPRYVVGTFYLACGAVLLAVHLWWEPAPAVATMAGVFFGSGFSAIWPWSWTKEGQ